jgi:hypothetical protein
MWYALAEGADAVVLISMRGLIKDRNLRRDSRMSLCVEDGMRYVTLEGRAELIDDCAQQEREVNELIALYRPTARQSALAGHRRVTPNLASTCMWSGCTLAAFLRKLEGFTTSFGGCCR